MGGTGIYSLIKRCFPICIRRNIEVSRPRWTGENLGCPGRGITRNTYVSTHNRSFLNRKYASFESTNESPNQANATKTPKMIVYNIQNIRPTCTTTCGPNPPVSACSPCGDVPSRKEDAQAFDSNNAMCLLRSYETAAWSQTTVRGRIHSSFGHGSLHRLSTATVRLTGRRCCH